MESVFGAANALPTIVFRKTTGAESPSGYVEALPQTFDYLVWYGKDRRSLSLNRLFYLSDLTTIQITVLSKGKTEQEDLFGVGRCRARSRKVRDCMRIIHLHHNLVDLRRNLTSNLTENHILQQKEVARPVSPEFGVWRVQID